MLPAAHRLRSSSDYRSVSRGRGAFRASGPLLVVHARRCATAHPGACRVGFVVSRSVGKAVVRNRTKRRLRALMAGRLAGVPEGTDVVVRANPAAASASFAALGDELDALLGRTLTGQASRRVGR